MKVYRYNLKEEDFKSFIKSGLIYLKAKKTSKDIEELKEYLREEGYKEGVLKGLISGFSNISKNDYIWLRSGKVYALAKAEDSFDFKDGLEIKAQIYLIDLKEVPESVILSIKGPKFISLKGSEIYEKSELIFNNQSYVYIDSGQITITNDEDSLKEEYKKAKNELSPMLRGKNELALYKNDEDIKITYRKNPHKKRERDKSKDFELILEMSSDSSDFNKDSKDKKDDHKNLPQIINDFNKEMESSFYGDFFKKQASFYFNMTNFYFKEMLNINEKVWKEYLKLFKKWR